MRDYFSFENNFFRVQVLSPISSKNFLYFLIYYIKQNIYIEDNYSKIIAKSGKRNAVGIFPTLEIQTGEVKEI